jgi:UPF0176 protein
MTLPPPSSAVETVTVAAFYHFTAFADPVSVRDTIAAVSNRAGIKGTILFAQEGFNGTIAGTADGVGAVVEALFGVAAAPFEIKTATAAEMPFHRLKLRIKREIVTLGVGGLDMGKRGVRVAPADWDALIAQDDVVLIDTRNDYEVAIGSFAGARDPHTRTFRDFPAWFEQLAAELRARPVPARIAMFCTGGIRCEKASALVRDAGFDEVYQLDGGILRYLEENPAAPTWQGECFVFDARVAVGPGLAPGSHDLCHACRMPLGAADKESLLYMEGVSCARCHATRSDAQRAGYAERARQVVHAAELGIDHIGAAPR